MLKKWINKMIEIAVLFFLSAYLIRAGACLLYSVWKVLAVIGGIILVVIILYYIIKHKRDNGKW